MLTASQKRCLDAIQDYQAAHGGTSPSYAEIAERTGSPNKSSVHRLVTQLEERGHIRRILNRARAIEVLEPRAPRQMITQPALGLVPRVPVVAYPNAKYFTVERVDEKAVLVPLKR